LEYLKIFVAKICEEICTHYKTRYAYRLWNAVRASSLYFTGTKSFVSERRDVCVKINCDVAYFELPVQESRKEKKLHLRFVTFLWLVFLQNSLIFKKEW